MMIYCTKIQNFRQMQQFIISLFLCIYSDWEILLVKYLT